MIYLTGFLNNDEKVQYWLGRAALICWECWFCILRMCHLIRLISKTQKNPELDILKMIYATSWGDQGMLPHPAFSRLLCTWTYWGSLFHVFKQGWWLGTPKFSFETADVDNDNSLYLKKWQIFVTNSDARIYVLYLHFFYVFIGGKVMYLGFYWECEIWGNFLCVLVQCDQHQSFPFHPFQTIAKKGIERKGYILRWFA